MRKRSKYKPKGVRLDVATWVINGFKPVSATGSAVLDLKIKNHSALEALRTGQAKRYDLDSIISALNVSEALSRLGIGHEYVDEIREGQDALLELSRRGINREDRFVAKASELTAINYGMELHDAQLDITTIAQLEKALDIVMNEIKSRKARVIEEKTAKCDKCCEPLKDCKCFTYKGVHHCDICNGKFEVGEEYYSDSPANFVHMKCRFQNPKEKTA